MAGLIKAWSYALLSLFVLYMLFGLMTPALSMIENAIFVSQNTMLMSEEWYQMYIMWAPILRNFFGVVSIGMYIGLVIYIVLAAATIEPNEYRGAY